MREFFTLLINIVVLVPTMVYVTDVVKDEKQMICLLAAISICVIVAFVSATYLDRSDDELF